MAWPQELQRGVLDSILDGTMQGTPPIVLMVVKKCMMGDGQRAVALLTDGGSRIPNPRNQRYIVRCILKDHDSAAMPLTAGSLIELTHWVHNTVAKQGEKILIALSVKTVGQFTGIDLSNLDNLFVKHPLNVLPENSGQQQPQPAQPSANPGGPNLYATAPADHRPSATATATAIGGGGGGVNPHHNIHGATSGNPYAATTTTTHQPQQQYNNHQSQQHQLSGGGQPPYVPQQHQHQQQQSGGGGGGLLQQQQSMEQPPNAWGPVGRRPPISSPIRAAPYGTGPVARKDDAMVIPIRGINTFVAKWCVKGRVAQKGDLRTYNNAKGEGKLFSADLVDREGGEIRATFFNKAADKFFDLLQANGVYTFSKGSVRQADKRFNPLNHPCELQFGEDAQIFPCEEDPAIPKKTYKFVKISELINFKKNETVDVIAVITKATDIASITLKATGEQKDKRDVTLLDDSGAEVDFTLWGDKVKLLPDEVIRNNAVVAVKGARVDEYSGRKLTSGYATSIDVNPDIPEATATLQWYQKVGCGVQPHSLTTVMSTGTSTKHNSIQEIVAAVTAPGTAGELEDKGLWFTTTATLFHVDRERQYFWTACPTCNKKVRNVGLEEGFAMASIESDFNAANTETASYFCNNCNVNVEKPIRKYLLQCEIRDDTGGIKCVAMAERGQALLGVDVMTIEASRDAHLQGGMPDCDFDDYFLWRQFKEYVFRIQAKAETYNDDRRIKYRIFGSDPIAKLYPAEAERKLGKIMKALKLPPSTFCLPANPRSQQTQSSGHSSPARRPAYPAPPPNPTHANFPPGPVSSGGGGPSGWHGGSGSNPHYPPYNVNPNHGARGPSQGMENPYAQNRFSNR